MYQLVLGVIAVVIQPLLHQLPVLFGGFALAPKLISGCSWVVVAPPLSPLDADVDVGDAVMADEK